MIPGLPPLPPGMTFPPPGVGLPSFPGIKFPPPPGAVPPPAPAHAPSTNNNEPAARPSVVDIWGDPTSIPPPAAAPKPTNTSAPAPPAPHGAFPFPFPGGVPPPMPPPSLGLAINGAKPNANNGINNTAAAFGLPPPPPLPSNGAPPPLTIPGFMPAPPSGYAPPPPPPPLPQHSNSYAPPPLPPPPPPHQYHNNNNNNNNNNSGGSPPYAPRGYNNNNNNNNNTYNNNNGQQQQQQQGRGAAGGRTNDDNNNNNNNGGGSGQATNTVWLGGGVDRLSDAEYITYFAPFGKIMRLGRLAPAKQTVFIHYRRREEAQNAVREMSSRGNLGPDIRVGFGKQYEYTAEEMAIPYNPNDPSQVTPMSINSNSGQAQKRGRDDDGPYGNNRDNNTNNNNGGGGFGRPQYGVPAGGIRIDLPPPGQQSASTNPYDQTFSALAGDNNNNNNNNNNGYGQQQQQQRRPAAPINQRSNVLWVGEIPSSVTTEELRNHFSHFNFKELSRNENKGIAFVHFETAEECEHVMGLMREIPLRGVLLKLNYGTARKPREEYHAQYGGPPASALVKKADDVDPSNEVPTNRLFVGGLPYDIQRQEIDEYFNKDNGFLTSRVMAEKHFAFIDFDSAENCATCRYRLLHTPITIRGQTLRISFAKDGHNNMAPNLPPTGMVGGSGPTPPPAPSASSYGASVGAAAGIAPTTGSGLIDFGTDIYGDRRAQQSSSAAPPYAAAVSLHGHGHPHPPPPPAPAPTLQPPVGVASAAMYLTRAREPPKKEPGVNDRIRALKGATYSSLAEGADSTKAINPEGVTALCEAVDATAGAEGEASGNKAPLEAALLPHLPRHATHAFNVIAKRLAEVHSTDSNRKLAVLMLCVRCVIVLAGPSAQYSPAAMEALVTIFGAAAIEQQSTKALGDIRKCASLINTTFFAASAPRNTFEPAFVEKAQSLLKDVENILADQESYLNLLMM